MLEFCLNTTKLLLTNWQNYLIGGLVVVSLIIFVVGCFKKAVLDRIKIKLLRKVLCAVTSLIFVFPATSIYLFLENIPLEYYWYGYTIFALFTILTYWAYEHFGARSLLHFLGATTWSGIKGMFRKVFIKVLTDEKANIKDELTKELKTTYKTAKETTKESLLKKADKDLKNL